MKNLHFYIQAIMILIALSVAIQIPSQSDLLGPVAMIEFILGVYQLGMSIMLRTKLSRKSHLLQIHFYASVAYLLTLVALGVVGPDWMGEWWYFALFVCPWGFGILFLVAIDELERARHYRL